MSDTPFPTAPGRRPRIRALAILAMAGGLFALSPAAQAAPLAAAPALAGEAPGVVAVQYGWGHDHHYRRHHRHWGHHHPRDWGRRDHGWGHHHHHRRHHGWGHRHYDRW